MEADKASKIDYVRYAIGRLLCEGEDVYECVGKISKVVLSKNDGLKKAIILKAYEPDKGNAVIRIPDNVSRFVYVIASYPEKRLAWLIPVEDISALKAIRLGERWECYKLGVTATKMERELRQKTLGLAKSLKEALGQDEGKIAGEVKE